MELFYSTIRKNSDAHALLIRVAEPFAAAPSLLHRDSGAPYLAGSGLCVSLSHTDGFALVCVGEKPLGCDVERLDRAISGRVTARVLTPRELAESEPLGKSGFLAFWCLRESLYKLSGGSIPFSKMEFTLEGGPRCTTHDCRCAVYYDVPGCIAAVCSYEAPPPRVRHMDASGL